MTVLAHTPVGVVDCSKPVYVKDASISHTYTVEDATCTFVVDTKHVIDAISVSRVDWPLPEVGDITVNGQTYPENAHASGHVEPFAILPMWNTKTLEKVTLTDANVVVRIAGRAFVSFGRAEELSLLYFGVIPAAYESREYVYDTPRWAMYVVHAAFAAVVAASIIACNLWVAVMGLRIWTVASFFIDVWVWSTTAMYQSSSTGGGLFIGVTVIRFMLYAYMVHLMSTRAPEDDNDRGSMIFGLVVLPLYIIWTLDNSNTMSLSGAFLLVLSLFAVCVCCCVCCFGVDNVRVLNGLLATLLGIVTNLGLGLLVPLSIWYAHTAKYHRLARSPGLKQQPGLQSLSRRYQLPVQVA